MSSCPCTTLLTGPATLGCSKVFNVPMAEVVVDNGYRMQGVQDGPSIDGVGGNEQELGVKG